MFIDRIFCVVSISMGKKDGQEQTEPSSGRETNTHGRSVIRSLHRLSAMSFPALSSVLPLLRVIFFSFFENKRIKRIHETDESPGIINEVIDFSSATIKRLRRNRSQLFKLLWLPK
jgi:hypothetical protein